MEEEEDFDERCLELDFFFLLSLSSSDSESVSESVEESDETELWRRRDDLDLEEDL